MWKHHRRRLPRVSLNLVTQKLESTMFRAFEWASVSEPGFLRFSKNVSKIGIPGEFLKMVSINGSAQYRKINIGRLQQNWLPISRLMEAKGRPQTFD